MRLAHREIEREGVIEDSRISENNLSYWQIQYRTVSGTGDQKFPPITLRAISLICRTLILYR